MKNLIVFTFALFTIFGSLSAQNIAGSYRMKFTKANQANIDRTPANEPFSGGTTFDITQNGDEITVTMTGFQSEWSAHIMKGRVGNNRFIAVLANADKSVYIIQGSVEGRNLVGHYAYIRYGDGNSGIVPGWHHVEYVARR